MPLGQPEFTPEEKIAGRFFRQQEQAKLAGDIEADPPTHRVIVYLSHYRHKCAGRGGVSKAIELKEVYIYSPEYVVDEDGGIEYGEEMPAGDRVAEDTVIPADRFGFIYKQGACRAAGCHVTCKSPVGVVVDAILRPPVQGRVSR